MRRILRAIWEGATLRCPRCHTGRLSASVFGLRQTCPHCQVRFEKREGDFVGAVVIAYALTSIAVIILVILTNLWTDLTVTAQIVFYSIFFISFLLIFYRNMKGIWFGILYLMVTSWDD